MLLECARKLLDYVQIKPAVVMPPDALFEWSAGLVTVNRRKTIVVTNTATRCCFVLHGVNTKELKKLDELLIEGVRTFLGANISSLRSSKSTLTISDGRSFTRRTSRT